MNLHTSSKASAYFDKYYFTPVALLPLGTLPTSQQAGKRGAQGYLRLQLMRNMGCKPRHLHHQPSVASDAT